MIAAGAGFAHRQRRRVRLAGVFIAAVVLCAAAMKSSADAPAYQGRVIAPPMSHLGADWLDRPERAETEQPDRVVAALRLQPGAVVADVGSGTGYFTLRLARAVGPSGRVLATDIQPEMLAILRQRLQASGLRNVEPILATPEDTRLPAGQIDLALLVDVYHELARPREMLAQLRRALRPSGRLVLVEYRGEDPRVPIKEEHKMTLAQIRAEVEPAGFVLSQVLEFLPQQRVVVFTRAEARSPGIARPGRGRG